MTTSKTREIHYSDFVFNYGGTFDPVHAGHIAIIEQLTILDNSLPIRLIPCAQPPLKNLPGASFQQRCEMLALGAMNHPNCQIDKRELNRSGPSFTVDTLNELVAVYPTQKQIWVMGADSLLGLPDWRDFKKLSQLCHLIVFNRANIEFDGLIEVGMRAGFELVSSYTELKQKRVGGLYFQNMPEKVESSSEIRQIASQSGHLDLMLPQSVIEYIRNHQLYRSEDN